MTLKSELPIDYIAPKKYLICSNEFIDCPVPIAVTGWPLLLICVREGKFYIWLYSRKNDSILPVIKEGRVVHDNFNCYVTHNEAKVLFMGEMILNIIGSEESIVVNYINLKPIGFIISGDTSGLKIGGGSFAKNKVIGSKIGIMLG